MRSSLYRAPSAPKDAGGKPLDGYIVVGDGPGPTVYLHAAPSTPMLTGMTMMKDGAIPWVWTDLKASHAGEANNILHAEYTDGTLLDGVLVRKRATRANVPAGATIVASDLPPHFWAGDE